jgi:hypothetical protein
MNLNWSSATGSITQEPGWQMWCCKDKGMDTKRDKHSPEGVVDGGKMEGKLINNLCKGCCGVCYAGR